MLELRKRADKSGTEPPRNLPGSNGKLPNENLAHGALLESWPLSAVELVGDAPREHNFADSFVARAIADGYLTFTNPRAVSSALPPGVQPYERDPVISGDEIVLDLATGELRYKVLEHPGKHPDESESGGWRVSHEYRCRLVKAKGD